MALHDLSRAGNATNLSRERLTYCGVPSAILFRPDLSLVTLFGIAPDFDYLNPTTWTGDTGFHFSDGVTPPQFRVGGGSCGRGCAVDRALFDVYEVRVALGNAFAAHLAPLLRRRCLLPRRSGEAPQAGCPAR